MPTCRACGDDHQSAEHCPRTRLPVSIGPCGTQVDRWYVERLLGSGGFGAVYVARHAVLGTRVAMKLLRPSQAQSSEVVQRFVREARTAASIGSPHIVRVSDFGTTADNASFLVMELLEGRDLATVLEAETTLAPARAVEIARQMLAGLAAAHRAGVIHRDLKPANVFLALEAGREIVKLVDFGISKSIAPGEETITRTGVVVGTPAYMAPEQLRGAPVDPRSDVYAASAVLYQMLAGHTPHEAPTFEQLVLRVCTSDAAPLRTVAPDVDPALAAVVERGLARDPAQRWPSAEAYGEALASLPATSLQRTRVQPFAATALAAATPMTPFPAMTPASPSPFPAMTPVSPSPFPAMTPVSPSPFAAAAPSSVPSPTPLPPGPSAAISGPISTPPWMSVAAPSPVSVQPLAPPSSVPRTYTPTAAMPPAARDGGFGVRTAVLGCAVLVLGVVTMGAIAFVTSRVLDTTRSTATTVASTAQPGTSLAPTGPKPVTPPTPDSDFPSSLTIGPGGELHIGGQPDDLPEPPPPAPPAMPPRGSHVVLDEPEVVSQDLDTAILRRVVRDAQSDFDTCRTGTATRVQAQIMFAFGHVTLAHAGNDNTGDHSTAECIAHRFSEHCGNRFPEGDGIVTVWANVPAR